MTATNDAMNKVTNNLTPTSADPMLKRGDTGSGVRTLQTLLNYRGAGLTVDGIFGANTEARVLEFQQAVQVAADGIVGSITWNAVRAGIVVARIAGSLINVRATPDRSSTIVQTLQSRDSIRILGRSAVLAENYRWFQVQAKQVTGWVREDLVRLLCPFTIPLPTVSGITIQSRPRPWMTDIDPAIEAGIRRGVTLGTLDRVRYLYQPLEFNGSGVPGAILVYLTGTPVCGTGGCTMLVMQAAGEGYRVLTRIQNVQQPVIVSSQRSNSYPDLIVYTSGGGVAAAYRRLRFNGSTYPTSPVTQAPLPAGTIVTGVALASRITPDLAAPLVAIQ